MKHLMQTMLLVLAIFYSTPSQAQPTVALDFNRLDCNGNQQHLFADLDAGNAVILEFFMQNCTPCITAGGQLETMKNALLTQYPGKVKSYAIGFADSYTCASNAAWVSTNGFTSIPMDSGATPVAYYGGFGMPTIVILGGGTAHSVLGFPYIGFSSSDIATMTTDISNFLKTTAIQPFSSIGSDLTIFPNPASNNVNVSLTLNTATHLSMEIINTAGQRVSLVLDENVNAGSVNRSIATDNLLPGLYLVKITANNVSTFRKIAIVK